MTEQVAGASESDRTHWLVRALDVARIGTWAYDLGTHVLDFSAVAKANHGLAPDHPITVETLRAMRSAEDNRRVRKAIVRANSGDGAFDVDYRIQPPAGPARWVLARGIVERNAAGEVARIHGITLDITDRKAAEHALQQSEARLRIAVQNSPVMLYNCDRGLRYSWVANPHPGWPAERMIGRRDDEILPLADSAPLMAAKRRVLETGVGERFEFTIKNLRGPFCWDVAIEPLRDPDGAIIGLTAAALEITDRKQAEERQALLMAELDHRVRNTLASIRSLVTLSSRRAHSLADFAAALEGRIGAFGRAHGLLTQSHWQGASLRQLVTAALEPYRGGAQTDIAGDDFMLLSRAAVSLSLVVHELATNAAKYGALSVPGGRVNVSWQLDASETWLEFVWRELEGPAILPPNQSGFGSYLIKQLFTSDLGASLDVEYPASGVVVVARLSVARIGAGFKPLDPAPWSPDLQPVVAVERRAISGSRVLVVEDDLLIGLDLELQLSEAGAKVIGPLPNVQGAMAAVAAEPVIDAAILDVNLAGERAFPIAAALEARAIPYLFLTGYDRASAVPEEFGSVPALQKPVTGEVVVDAVEALLQGARGSG